MHYRGFVIVTTPSNDAVDAAMAPHREKDDDTVETSSGHWDWYRVGGRYDGYLVSDDEMAARATDGGYNFGPENERIDWNFRRVSEIPPDRRSVFFFVADGTWVDCETWNGKEFVETPDFSGLLDAALAAHMDDYVVVIDAHS